MRAFYAAAVEERQGSVVDHSVSDYPSEGQRPSWVDSPARVAVYDSPLAAPRVIDVPISDPGEFIEHISDTVYKFAREGGGSIPYSAVREVVENFIHAGFREPVVSILDGGRTIRFADQGPGISDKHRAALPGFTTATAEMKTYIRGVGSGLPIVREYLAATGGSILIDDNLGGGAVVTLTCGGSRETATSSAVGSPLGVASSQAVPAGLPGMGSLGTPATLSGRQKRVLALVMETGSAGPSIVARELSIALSTAHRDLAHLEGLGLIESDAEGKRSLSEHGIRAADELLR